MKEFENKKILVTGATGSIGSAIVRQLLKFSPKQVRVFDQDEAAGFDFQRELKDNQNARFLIGNIRDKGRLKLAMQDVDIVFHAAALKHVPSCEYNPFEAVKTNVYGTQNLIEAALEQNVGKVVFISTDKATSPVNTMGATKLLAERLVVAAEYFKGNKRTVFSAVRFGNVIGSRGSVVDVFKHQIKNDKAITITEPNMTRFTMSIPQAVNLVLKTAAIMQGGEIFILKMPVFRLQDLADAMIEELAAAEIKKEIIGVRPGEKIDEELMNEEEAANALETDDMFIVLSHIDLPNFTEIEHRYKGSRKCTVKEYNSKIQKPLSKEALKELMKKEKII